jgi:hypothetical protein
MLADRLTAHNLIDVMIEVGQCIGLISSRQFSIVFPASLPVHCILDHNTMSRCNLRATSGQYCVTSFLFLVLCNVCMSHSFPHTWRVTTEINDLVRDLLHILYLTARTVPYCTCCSSLHVMYLTARALHRCTYRTLLHVLFLAARAVPYCTYCNLLHVL